MIELDCDQVLVTVLVTVVLTPPLSVALRLESLTNILVATISGRVVMPTTRAPVAYRCTWVCGGHCPS